MFRGKGQVPVQCFQICYLYSSLGNRMFRQSPVLILSNSTPTLPTLTIFNFPDILLDISDMMLDKTVFPEYTILLMQPITVKLLSNSFSVFCVLFNKPHFISPVEKFVWTVVSRCVVEFLVVVCGVAQCFH